MLSFIQGLLIFVFVQFVTAFALSKIGLGPRIKHAGGKVSHYSNVTVMLLVVPYTTMTVYSVLSGTFSEFWPFFQALLIGAIILTSLISGSPRSTVIALALLIPLATSSASLIMNGAQPMGQDEGRFAGFANRIVLDGRWQPYVYREDPYYQVFDVVPYLMAALSTVTGLDVLNFVHPLTISLVILVAGLGIYVTLRNVGSGNPKTIGVIGAILLFLTPTIGLSSFIPQTLGIVLYIMALMLLSSKTVAKMHNGKFAALIVVSIAGIVTHGTYPILLLLTLVLMLRSSRKSENPTSESHLIKSLIAFVTVLTLVYWSSSLILSEIVRYSTSWIISLINLLLGRSTPFGLGRPVWFSGAPFPLSYTWVLLIALSGAYVFTQIPKWTIDLKKVKDSLEHLARDWPVTLAVIGILWLGLALVLRATPGGETIRYFYPFYVLLIPAAAMIVNRIGEKKRIINIVIIAAIISIGSFYSLLESTNDILLVANKRSWVVAESLASNVSSGISYVLDPRIDIPFVALTLKSTPALYYSIPDRSYNASLIVVNLDSLGGQWASHVLGSRLLQGIANDSYDIVFTDGMYKAYVVRSNG